MAPLCKTGDVSYGGLAIEVVGLDVGCDGCGEEVGAGVSCVEALAEVGGGYVFVDVFEEVDAGELVRGEVEGGEVVE